MPKRCHIHITFLLYLSLKFAKDSIDPPSPLFNTIQYCFHRGQTNKSIFKKFRTSFKRGIISVMGGGGDGTLPFLTKEFQRIVTQNKSKGKSIFSYSSWVPLLHSSTLIQCLFLDSCKISLVYLLTYVSPLFFLI